MVQRGAAGRGRAGGRGEGAANGERRWRRLGFEFRKGRAPRSRDPRAGCARRGGGQRERGRVPGAERLLLSASPGVPRRGGREPPVLPARYGRW